MDTKQVVARFEAERQAVAKMDHPNIAKVLDAGMTVPLGASASLPAGGSITANTPARMPALPAGRPYFVMELVRGIRITDYCDQADLTTKERLDLFIKVCQAIQHAHQKGIIQRDIKPSNILVTLDDGVPVPKVIDFGIAKATEGRLTDNTVYTQLHQFTGTPAYTSLGEGARHPAPRAMTGEPLQRQFMPFMAGPEQCDEQVGVEQIAVHTPSVSIRRMSFVVTFGESAGRWKTTRPSLFWAGVEAFNPRRNRSDTVLLSETPRSLAWRAASSRTSSSRVRVVLMAKRCLCSCLMSIHVADIIVSKECPANQFHVLL